MAIFSISSMARVKDDAENILATRTISFTRIVKYLWSVFTLLYRFFAFHVSPFWIQLCYFLSLCLLGSLAMMTLKPSNPSFSPRYVDMLYMSTSALTVSGLNSVELENFSSSQIVVLTLLMLLGGEAFTSMLGLLFRNTEPQIDAIDIELEPRDISFNAVEAGQNIGVVVVVSSDKSSSSPSSSSSSSSSSSTHKDNKYNSIRCLLCIVFSYIFLIHVSGSIFILLYVSLVSSARHVLNGRGIPKILFSISVTVSSFANAGLIPTNENMVIFKKNPGLLLIIIPQILSGNTLFPVFLRLILWALKKVTRREQQFSYIMRNSKRVNYSGLMTSKLTACLAMTVISFIVAQVTLYCAMDWNSAVFDGLTSYQKIVSALFMAVNSRHAGEGTLDLSITSPSVLILFIIMMYLPGSTAYVPFDLKDDDEEEEEETEKKKKRKRMSTRKTFVHKYVLSHITCLAIFVMAICITEREKLSKDPLNFPVLNILLEVVSAYGNVGFSTGYSCGRQLAPDKTCKDKWISLSGKWSDKGKLILVVVLLFGRLKKFTMEAGRAWILS